MSGQGVSPEISGTGFHFWQVTFTRHAIAHRKAHRDDGGVCVHPLSCRLNSDGLVILDRLCGWTAVRGKAG